MTGKLSKKFHGVGIGPLSKIYAVKVFALSLLATMAITVVDFSRDGYKIRKIFR
jgi:hypothetical protein